MLIHDTRLSFVVQYFMLILRTAKHTQCSNDEACIASLSMNALSLRPLYGIEARLFGIELAYA